MDKEHSVNTQAILWCITKAAC